MSGLALPGWTLDLIIGLTFLEFVILGLYRTRSSRGTPSAWVDLALHLGPGTLLMLALRLTAPQTLSAPVMACLAAAGLVHTIEMVRCHPSANASPGRGRTRTRA